MRRFLLSGTRPREVPTKSACDHGKDLGSTPSRVTGVERLEATEGVDMAETTATYPITFVTDGPSGLSRRRDAFVGRGTLVIGPDTVTLSGRKRRLMEITYGREAEERFRREEIVNVETRGATMSFALRPFAAAVDIGVVQSFSFGSAEEAEEARALLPDTQTVEFHEVVAEQQEFRDKLLAATPRVFVTPVIIGLNAAVFIAMVVAGAGLVDSNAAVHLRWGANFAPLGSSCMKAHLHA
jgi:hypothetical protein